MIQSVEQVSHWQVRLVALRRGWKDVASARAEQVPGHWGERVLELRERQAALVTSNQWRSGPTSLVEAMGIAYRETRLTAGLAWLLRPDGHHGLGDTFLRHLLLAVDLVDVDTAGVRIEVEEARDAGRTRADLVLYGQGWTLCLEAKVFAFEGENQLDRLHALWADETEPRFVFLTRCAYEPMSAIGSHLHWRNLTWSDIAGWLREACRTVECPAPGVCDYLTTLEVHHHG